MINPDFNNSHLNSLVPDLHLDDQANQVHETFASLSLSKVNSLMPRLEQIDLGDDSLRYVVLGTDNGITPTANFENPETIVVSGGQFAQNYDSGKWLMNEYIRSIATPDSPMFYFPSPRLGQMRNLKLSRKSMAQIMRGNYGPIIDLRRAALDSWRIDAPNLFAYGHSQEASIATQFAKEAQGDFNRVGLLSSDDPSLETGRTVKELKRDFQGDGASELVGLFDAVRDSEIPVLVKAQGISPNHGKGLTGIRLGMLMDLGGLGLSQGFKINSSLTKGMANANSIGAIQGIVAEGGRPFVVRAENSRILTDKGLRSLLGISGVKASVIVGYGHEYFDNLRVASSVTQTAVQSIETDTDW